MLQYSDILITADFDRTLTDPDSKVPARNVEAVRWFIEQGGAFTINTGRSWNLAERLLGRVPINAPLLLFNGAAAVENGQILYSHTIDAPMWEMVMAVSDAFPELNVEIQGLKDHYIVRPKEGFVALYESMKWHWTEAVPGTDLGPFVKFAVYGVAHTPRLADMYEGTAEEFARIQELDQFIRRRWGDKVDICYAAPRILDVQPKGINKGLAARELLQRLGRKILVCVGDADNDISMLEAADFAYCPGDAVIADRYENVCSCGEGAVADVIYKKIPEILGFRLDNMA